MIDNFDERLIGLFALVAYTANRHPEHMRRITLELIWISTASSSGGRWPISMLFRY